MLKGVSGSWSLDCDSSDVNRLKLLSLFESHVMPVVLHLADVGDPSGSVNMIAWGGSVDRDGPLGGDDKVWFHPGGVLVGVVAPYSCELLRHVNVTSWRRSHRDTLANEGYVLERLNLAPEELFVLASNIGEEYFWMDPVEVAVVYSDVAHKGHIGDNIDNCVAS